jgi:hypothetical protein
MAESSELLVLYPLTLLKYGLPVAFTVFVYVASVGGIRAAPSIVAALVFCNFKLAALIVQSLVGPLRSHQKLYEFAMSDFLFVSQILIIVAVTFLVILVRGKMDQGGSTAELLAAKRWPSV